jgi:hypothetical protein
MTQTNQYATGADAAIVLNYGLATQAMVQGLNKLSSPGFEMNVVTIDEARQVFARSFTTGGTYSEITFGGYLVINDIPGQRALKQHAMNRTKLVGRDMLCFFDANHFFTTDLANDPASSMQISGITSGEVGKNDLFPFAGKIVPNGRLAIYSAHITEGSSPTLAFVKGTSPTADTITDSADGFVSAGFVAGMTLLIFNSTSNDAVATTISEVAAGVLTLASKGVVTSEAGIDGMELHGGSI